MIQYLVFGNFIKEIFNKGISQDEFVKLFANNENQNWGTLLSNDKSIPVKFFCNLSESNKSYLSEFLKTDLTRVKNIQNTDEMLLKIQNEKYALGFCKLVDIIDPETQKMKEGLSLVPIDINGNNKVELVENIYKYNK